MSSQTTAKPIEILLVEDDPGQVRLTKEALKETHVSYRLNVVENGEDALKYVRQKGEYSDSVPPDLILLDLNLPKKDGREVLAEFRKDPDLKTIPVVILTTSKAQEDVVKAYGLQATYYVNKPVGLEPFISVMKSILVLIKVGRGPEKPPLSNPKQK